ncbi:segregation/condensation protein A, partial [Pirellulales bacterium]|nr:segregation/condensation protein A [Pirellulales bacterium]
MRFRVSLDIFAGPLDLLLYLVRKQEVEILDVKISTVTEQYLEILTVLEAIDLNAAGDFLEIAAMLMEIKSNSALPQPDEPELEADDVSSDLVKRLLEYKRYKEAASRLEERGRAWQQRFARTVNEAPVAPRDPVQQPLQPLEIWDLVSAFNRVLQKQSRSKASKIRYDDTPIETYMQQIAAQVAAAGELKFASLFESVSYRSQLIGMFLAVLELIRSGELVVSQTDVFGDIVMTP